MIAYSASNALQLQRLRPPDELLASWRRCHGCQDKSRFRPDDAEKPAGKLQDGFVMVDLAIDRTGAAREAEALYASDLVKAVSMYRFEKARLHVTPVQLVVNMQMVSMSAESLRDRG